MKRILFFIIVCCCLLTGKANISATSDSLVQVLQTLPHDTTRLNTINQIIIIEQNNPLCIQYSDTLLKEALLLENDKYTSLAAYYHLLYYYNRSKQDSVAKWMGILEPSIRKSGMWDYYFDAKRFQIDLHAYNEQYELAITEAKKLQKKASGMNNHRGLIAACQCLGNAYIGSQRWDEGNKVLEEAYELLGDDGSTSTRISLLSQLISIHKELKNHSKLIACLKELKSVLDQLINTNPSLKEGYLDVYLYCEIFYTYYYLNINQPERAYPHLQQAKEYLDENTYFMYRALYFDVHARYSLATGEYQQASDYIDTTLVMLKDDFLSDYANQLLEKARIWRNAGDYKRAVPIYQQSLILKDSIATVLANTQMEQIKSNFRLDKIELEQKRQHNESRLIHLIFILIILLVLFVFMARLFIVRRALKLSENGIRKATEAVRRSNEVKDRFLSHMSYNIRTPLNNVVGFSQLIAAEPDMDKETRDEYSAIIHQSSEKLMRLVNDVLDLSRLEAQMMKFQLQDYDAVALCNEACYMARMKNEQTGITVLFSSDIESQTIHTDTARLTQALLSTLVYPQEWQEERTIRFTLSLTDEGMLHFRISNSPLADRSFVSQETIIRHDINRLLLKHFGGTYQVNDKAAEGPEIVFTYPVASESE